MTVLWRFDDDRHLGRWQRQCGDTVWTRLCQIVDDLLVAELLLNSRMVGEDYHVRNNQVRLIRSIIIASYWRSIGLVESSRSIIRYYQIPVGLDWWKLACTKSIQRATSIRDLLLLSCLSLPPSFSLSWRLSLRLSLRPAGAGAVVSQGKADLVWCSRVPGGK